MSDHKSTKAARNWVAISCGFGAVARSRCGGAFVATFQPSERARAAGAAVEADVGASNRAKAVVEWRGKPVWIIRRTPEQLAALPGLDPLLADPNSLRKPDELTPEYARNTWRSRKPETLVGSGSAPTWAARRRTSSCRPAAVAAGQLAGRVPVPCHGSTFDAWPAACSRTSPRRTTWRCRRTCTCPDYTRLLIGEDKEGLSRRPPHPSRGPRHGRIQSARRRPRRAEASALLTWVDNRFPLTKLLERPVGQVLRPRTSTGGTSSARWRCLCW